MAGGVRLSKKYGMNPSMSVCFFCGKVKNEIALVGKIDKKDENGKIIERDVEAPKYAIYDYEPCDECKKKMASGITLIGVTEDPLSEKMPPITKQGDTELYPTGRFATVKEEAYERVFRGAIKDDALYESILKSRKAYIDDKMLRDLLRTE